MKAKTSNLESAVREASGAVIRRHRRQLGLSQSAVAQLLDITYQQVQKYERGKSTLNLAKFLRVARILQVDPLDLLTEVLQEAGQAHQVREAKPAYRRQHPLVSIEKKLEGVLQSLRDVTQDFK